MVVGCMSRSSLFAFALVSACRMREEEKRAVGKEGIALIRSARLMNDGEFIVR